MVEEEKRSEYQRKGTAGMTLEAKPLLMIENFYY
jgi:hypothetical protein